MPKSNDPTAETDYACFMDVLGYGAILLESGTPPVTERERLNIFLQIWENLFGAFVDVRETLDRAGDNEKLHLNCFSDSFYISSGNPQRLVFAAASLYYKVYLYFEHQPQNTSWLPWLRGGVGAGWLVDIRDPAIKGLTADPQFEFRNPVGPALANAYMLSEKSGLKGFRLFIPESLKKQVFTPLGEMLGDPDLQRLKNRLCARPWPVAGTFNGETVFDVPWWRLNDSGMNKAQILERHYWQVSRFGNPTFGQTHYDATLPLLQTEA